MLVLSRFKNESIIMTTSEGRVEIIIVDTDNRGKVKLGIVAPKSISVHRAEVQLDIDKEKGVANGTITNLPG